MARNRVWTLSAVAFVVFAAMLCALVQRATDRVAGHIESRFGWRADRAAADEFVASMGPRGVFATAAGDAMAVPLGTDVFLWRAADKAAREQYRKPFGVSNQKSRGSCVGHGASHAVYFSESVAWAAGLRAEAPYRPSTSSIYGGSRVEARSKNGDGLSPVGGFSDGSTGFHAARWLRDYGVCYQRNYPEFGLNLVDSPELEGEWGAYGNGGKNDRGRFDAEARKHPIKSVARVSTWAELTQSLSSGFAVSIASDVAFQANSRDADGFIARSGGVWPHQMAVAGVRWAKNAPPGTSRPRDGVLIVNSWGNWPANGGGKYPADQPDGSFWVTRADIEAVLAAGDSWSFSTSANWEPVPLDNGAWFEPAPPEPAPAGPPSAAVAPGSLSLSL